MKCALVLSGVFSGVGELSQTDLDNEGSACLAPPAEGSGFRSLYFLHIQPPPGNTCMQGPFS